jgi:hypothetical protein
MLISKDLITGHGVNEKGRPYSLSGIALNDGNVRIQKVLTGAIKQDKFDLLWCSFYLCGYKPETHEKVF